MHDSAYDPYSQVSHDLAFSQSLLGKECQACRRILPYSVFQADSTVRDGRALICPRCKSTPRLSAEENLHRVREANFSSNAVSVQRRPDEEDYIDRDAKGRVLSSSDFCYKLKKAGVKLTVGPAAFLDEMSLYVDDNQSPSGARYMGWLPIGYVQEFSEYSYNDYLVPTDEIVHGYRGILKNLILQGFLTEKKCEEVFGRCNEKVWAKTMWSFRNAGAPYPGDE